MKFQHMNNIRESNINFGNDIINWEKEHVYLYFYYNYIILLYLHYLYTLRIQCIENINHIWQR
jgi:hypothetical protein